MIEQEKKKKIPNGSYYVRFVLKGYAYVELSSDKVIKVKDIDVERCRYLFCFYVKKNVDLWYKR